MARKPNYLAWSISKKAFPTDDSLEKRIRFLVQYGVLAPSTHNTQPWLIAVRGSRLTVRPDQTKMLPAGDPSSTGMLISIGTFVENIVQAAEEFRLSVEVAVSDDKVVMEFNEKKKTIQKLGATTAILRRCSNKFWYKNSSKKGLQKLTKKLMKFDSQYIKIVHEQTRKSKIINIHLSAAKESTRDKKFVYEVSKWLRTNATKHYDGMPGFVQGHSRVKSHVGKFLARTLKKMPPQFIEYERELLQSTPFFVIFGAKSNQPRDIIRAGMLVERFWLSITEEGLVAHPLFAMIKSENHRIKLKKSVGMITIPVFFLRVGHPTVIAEHTPRRPFPWN